VKGRNVPDIEFTPPLDIAAGTDQQIKVIVQQRGHGI